MMSSNVGPSKKYLDSSTRMKFSLESKQSTRQQQNSKPVKERFLSHHEHQSLKYQGKLKVKTGVGPPYSDVPHDLRREAEGKILVQPNSSRYQQWQSVKGKATKNDELVKYMSNLPGYLQRMEGGENIQDKAFNVGVLDWARLEKWKYNQKCAPGSGSYNVSSTSSSLSLKTTIKSSTFSGVAQGGACAHQSTQHPSLCPSFNASHKNGLSPGVKPSSQKVLHLQDFEISSKSNLARQRKILRSSKSLARGSADVTLRKGKTKDSDQKVTSEMGNLSTNLSYYGEVALRPKEKVSAWNDEIKKKVDETKELNMSRKALDRKIISEMGTSSPKLRTYGVSLNSKEKLSAGYDETKKRTEKLRESNIDHDHQHLPDKHKNIVLLLPREFSQNSSLKESRALPDENSLEASQNSLSGGFPLEDFSSEECCSGIPHSCPLPSKVETKIEPILMADNLKNNPRVELSSDAFRTSVYSNKTSSMLPVGKDAEQNNLNHMNANVIENLKILDQEMAEMAATRGRHPSPNRRFSFSLSRIGRSFSLKEGSAVPQLSSTYVPAKSGPVKSEGASFLDDSNREKENGPNRARSSPLRRILDPLLRLKGPNPVYAAETVPLLKGNLSNFKFRPVNGSESLPNENHVASTVQALVQRTMKDGLPLFTFVVDNNSNVLAATMKNLTSGKDNSSQDYTFYSVNEIKRKSGGWISKGSKEKNSGYIYKVVGQTKVSSPNFLDLTGQNLKNQYILLESVLFGVELRQADQASSKLKTSEELAAVVLKMPIESLSHLAPQRDKDMIEKGLTECLPGSGCSFNSGEKDNSYSATVILPGGVHGLPNKGAPSPLIERWKSGGLCDCGGWDVGCKLRILTNHNQSCKTPRTSNYCTNSAWFELFVQGEAQQKRPIFSLVPLNKEIFSVEFDSSVSLLQAFFVCVTVLSFQRSSDISEVNSPYEAVKRSQEEPTVVNGNEIKKVPAKYAPNPPASPVGRV